MILGVCQTPLITADIGNLTEKIVYEYTGNLRHYHELRKIIAIFYYIIYYVIYSMGRKYLYI